MVVTQEPRASAPRVRSHPVWEVYNEYRTARLNRKYYACQLSTLQRRNFWIELTLAITSSSAVAGLWLPALFGDLFWKAVGSAAAVLAVYQPTSKITDRIRSLEQRVTGYWALELDLERIARRVRTTGKYDEEQRRQFEDVLDRRDEMIKSYVDAKVDEKLRVSCQRDVMQELPAATFFVPEET